MKEPSKILKDVQSQRKKLNSEDAATKFFAAQVNAIKSIKATDGYKEIKDYFYREFDSTVDQLGWEASQDAVKTAYLRGQMNAVRSFLSRLDNLEDYKA